MVRDEGEYDADVPYDGAVKGEGRVGIGPRLPTSPLTPPSSEVTGPQPGWTGPWPHLPDMPAPSLDVERVMAVRARVMWWIDRAGLVCAAGLAGAMVWAAWTLGTAG